MVTNYSNAKQDSAVLLFVYKIFSMSFVYTLSKYSCFEYFRDVHMLEILPDNKMKFLYILSCLPLLFANSLRNPHEKFTFFLYCSLLRCKSMMQLICTVDKDNKAALSR